MENTEYKLSNQAVGAIMMALQKGLMEETDITGLLKDFEMNADADNKLQVLNPPVVSLEED